MNVCFPFPCSAVNWLTDTRSGKQYTELNTKVSQYEDARKLCQGVGGILPEPRNSEENDFLHSLGTTEWFFLGLTHTDPDSQYVWTSDGLAVTWTAWDSGEPKSLKSTTDCVRMLKKDWTSVWCGQSVTKPVVCEKTRTGKYTIHHDSLVWS